MNFNYQTFVLVKMIRLFGLLLHANYYNWTIWAQCCFILE